MLQLYNLNKEKLEGLTKYKDLKIESTLSTGDKVLSFSYLKKCSSNIIEEGYIRTKDVEFVIKQVDKSLDSWINVTCNLNIEELESMIEEFNSTEQTIENCINFALVGTGWTVQVDTSITKRRTVRKTNSSIWDIIQQAKKTYNVEIEFDTINKIVLVKEKIGGDKGVYFTDELNLKSLSVQSNSYDFYTRILAIGKEDLKVEVENYNYSSKRKTLIWKDERYTDKASLREDATLKLEELSKPYRAYSADVIDLAKLNEKYKDILSYKLGDTITLVSKDNGIREKQRIVKTVEYLDNPSQNTVEIANTTLSFEDVQKEFQDTTDTVNNIIEDDGTISEGAIKETVKKLTIDKVNVTELEAVVIRVGTLEATKANITDLTAINVKIENLQATKIEVTDLTATNIKFNVASGGTLDLQTLLAKHITGENGQFLNITSSNTVIANAVIKDAMIENISVNKLLAGTISTNKFNISSDDGGITIVGPTMQFKDKNNKVRIQMGQDTQGNFNFILRGEDGTTTLIDHTGIKEKAIADKLIKSNMVADNAIGEQQINYSSLVTGLNKDTNTSLIKASKVAIDLTGQSLEVSFNSLKSNVDGIQIGGRNLLKGTKDFSGTWGSYGTITKIVNSYKGFTVYYTPTNWGRLHQSYSFEEGKTYTLSAYVKADKENVVLWCHGEDIKAGVITSNVKLEWTRYSYTFVAPKTASSRIDFESSNIATIGGNLYLCAYKLEEGNKATDWTPAPEDVDSKIESNTTAITVAQGKIDALISENTIIKGDVTTISDKYTSLKATVDGINTTVASHTSSIGTINTNISGLSGKVTTVENNYASLSQDLSGFKTTVSNTYSTKTELSGVDGKVTSLTSRVSTAESSITQLNNKITLKVEATDVTEAINNVQIGGRNLLLYSNLNKTLSDSKISVRGSVHKISIDTTNKYNGYNSLKIIATASGNISGEDILWASILGVSGGSAYGKNMIFSFYAKADSNVSLKARLGYGSYKVYSKVDLTTSWERYEINVGEPTNTSINGEVVFYLLSAGTIYISNAKLEEGNKATDWTPAPEDVDSEISSVDTKVTTVSNKVATIETNLTSITSRVSSTETSISTINGNVKNLQTRMATAEQKITDSAIISTVQATINTAKNEAINSSNSSTDTKLKNYSTTTQMNTAITQSATSIKNEVSNTYLSKNDANNTYATKSSMELTAKQLKLDFSSSGGYNLIKNGNFENGTYGWITQVFGGDNSELSVSTKESSEWIISNKKALWCFTSVKGAKERTVRQEIQTVPGKTYTLSYYIAGHRSTKVVRVRDTPNWNDIASSKTYGEIVGGSDLSGWVYDSITFTATSTTTLIFFDLRDIGTNADGYMWLHDVTVVEGSYANPWIPNKEEVVNGSTVINASGVTIYNGALTIKNNAGTDVIKGDSNGNLTMRGIFEQYGSNGVKSVDIKNNQVNLYDWSRDGDLVGGLVSITGNTSGRGISMLYADKGNLLWLGYCNLNRDTYYRVISIDDVKVDNSGQSMIGIYQKTSFMDYADLTLYGNTHTIPLGRVSLDSNNNTVLLSRGGINSLYIGEMTSADTTKYSYFGRFNDSGLYVWGGISCSGTKSRLVPTKNFDAVKMNAYETADCYFGDIGEGKIGEDGLCYIYLDPILLETINTECNYQVFLTNYGIEKDDWCRCIIREKEYFIVKGTPGIKFGWELKAKQKGYETDRLEREVIEQPEQFGQLDEETNIIEELSYKYLNDYEKEMIESD